MKRPTKVKFYLYQSFIESLKMYYCTDWISFALGTYGLYLLSEQIMWGFLFTFVSLLCSAFCAIVAKQYGFLTANITQAVIAINGVYTWWTG